MSNTPEILAIIFPHIIYLSLNIFLLVAAIYFRKSTQLSGGILIIIGVILHICLTFTGAALSLTFVLNSGADIMKIASGISALTLILAIAANILIGVGLISCASAFKRRFSESSH